MNREREEGRIHTANNMICRVIMIALSVIAISPCWAQPLDFNRQLVGVEQKAAKEDQDIEEVADLFYGISPEHFFAKLKEVGVNVITVPISRAGQASTVAFLKGLEGVKGDQVLSVVISHRKWSLDREKQREDWAVAMAKTYNAIDAAGLGDMVAACRFDENDPLKGAASTSSQWEERFENILDALDRLNQKTNNAFKDKSVLMHGEGYGPNFKGVYKAHMNSDFEVKMRARCVNYGFTFKLFDYGAPVSGQSSSMAEWEQHFRDHCGLDELKKLKKPVLFVGNAGDGLFPRSLDSGFELKGAISVNPGNAALSSWTWRRGGRTIAPDISSPATPEAPPGEQEKHRGSVRPVIAARRMEFMGSRREALL